MIVQQKQGLRYYQFETLCQPGLLHGIFTRQGGTSPPPWASLNLGGTVGDDQARVQQNLARLLEVIQIDQRQLAQVRQVHSRDVIKAEAPMDAVQQGDAIITSQPGLVLLMRFADCVPLILYDPIHKAVAIAHAGWKGTVLGVAQETVRRMEQNFGSDPAHLLAGIGPSIGPDHYRVGEDVIQQVQQAFPDAQEQILTPGPDGVKLDLWKANQISLREAGVRSIETAGICTGCNTREWFSHRAESGRTGRFGAVVGLTT